jgi:hypothetical protein
VRVVSDSEVLVIFVKPDGESTEEIVRKGIKSYNVGVLEKEVKEETKKLRLGYK